MNDEDREAQFQERISFTEDDIEFIEPTGSDDAGKNLVELVELLQEIDEKSEEAKENGFVIYDKSGDKIYL